MVDRIRWDTVSYLPFYNIIEIEKRHNKMVDRIRYPTVSYLPFYYVFFQFLLLTIFNLQANILTTKDILSNLGCNVYVSGWERTCMRVGTLGLLCSLPPTQVKSGPPKMFPRWTSSAWPARPPAFHRQAAQNIFITQPEFCFAATFC